VIPRIWFPDRGKHQEAGGVRGWLISAGQVAAEGGLGVGPAGHEPEVAPPPPGGAGPQEGRDRRRAEVLMGRRRHG